MLSVPPGAPRLVAGAWPPAGGYDADIIILTRGRVGETIEAVESALAQRGLSFHVSLLDQDPPAAAQAAYLDAFGGREHFGYHVAPENLGVAGGRNFLASLGAGEVIVALDNDAVFADERVVAAAVSRFARQPELGAMGFKILGRDGVALDLFSWGYPRRLLARAHGDFTTTTFVGAGHAIRRRAWNAAGGYDEDFFFTWEEYDFALRLIALRWSILYAGGLAVVHKVSPEARVSWGAQRMRVYLRNRLILARKWNISWLELLPRIAGCLLMALRGRRLLSACRGLMEAIAADRRLFRRRLTPSMRDYLRAHEGRYRDGIFRALYRQLATRIRTDPR